MLMPPCEDLEVLRDWAQEHGWTACNFGRSFFPTEPEHRITFQVNDTNKQKSKELVNSFFFFKALGFVITPQPVVQAISSCEPLDFTVQACLGPKGLTRLAVKIFYPKKESIYQMICGGARIPFEKSKSDMVSANLVVMSRTTSISELMQMGTYVTLGGPRKLETIFAQFFETIFTVIVDKSKFFSSGV